MNADVRVISVTYQGSYPAIGVRYLNEVSPDLGPLIEAEIDLLVQDEAMRNFIQFVGASEASWSEVTRKLFSGGNE